MTTFEIFVATYMAVVPAALGALFWSRLNRIETTLIHIASTNVSRDEFIAVIGSLRSDVTQVALAVGARPRASEG